MAQYASLRSAIAPYALMLATEARNTVQSRMECALWEAIEIDGLIRRTRDPVTGAVMRLASTPEIDSEDVRIQFPGENEIGFSIRYELKNRAHTGSDDNPMIKISILSIKQMISKRPGSHQANTRFIRYLLEGLATINRKWPLCASPFFYSNLGDYQKKNVPLPFDFPSDDELARL